MYPETFPTPNQLVFLTTFVAVLTLTFLASHPDLLPVLQRRSWRFLWVLIIAVAALVIGWLAWLWFQPRLDELVFYGLLGTVAALATAELLQLSGDNRRDRATIPWFVIAGGLFFVGLFMQPLYSLLSQMQAAKFTSTGIELTLQKTSVVQDREVVRLADMRGDTRFSEITHYQFGVGTLVTARAKLDSDLRFLAKLCEALPDECDPAFFDETTAFRSDDAPTEAAPALVVINSAFQDLERFTACLKAYGSRFPNGMPIQDELSEIAVAIADQYEAAFAAGASPDPLGRILRKLTPTEGLTAADGEVSDCADLETEDGDFRDIRAAMQKLVTASEDDLVIPHVSLVEGALMIAAGYPYDGAEHMRRRLTARERRLDRRQKEAAAAGRNDGDEASFASWNRHADWAWRFFAIRTLSTIEQVYDAVGEKRLQARALADLRRTYDAILEDFFWSTGAASARDFDDRSANFLAYTLDRCARGAGAPELGTLRKTFVQHFYTRLTYENRFWDIPPNGEERSAEELDEAATQLWRLYQADEAFGACFPEDAVPANIRRETRVVAGVNSARVLMGKVNRRWLADASLRQMGDPEVKATLCQARRRLVEIGDELDALQQQVETEASDQLTLLGRPGAGSTDGSTWIEREQTRAQSLIRSIDETGVVCRRRAAALAEER